MAAAVYPIDRYRPPASWRSRSAAGAIALGLVALLILVLLRMGALPGTSRRESPTLSTFDVSSAAGPQARERTRPTKRLTEARRDVAPPPPPPAREVPLPPPPLELPGVIKLSREDFAASNVGRFPRAAPDAAAGEAIAAANAGGGDDAVIGTGPGGERLYQAEWHRRPTRAEMATYLPRNGRPGWGMVACRTVERYRVEDCREIGESPGSGIARSVRLAAWQFLVRPPRIGGKPQIGTWVRIRFDLTVDADALTR